MARKQRKAAKTQSRSRVSKREIGELQKTLTKSVLTGEPLPGSTRSVVFPDAAFLDRHPSVYVDDENISGGMSLEGVPKPVRIVSRDAVAAKASSEGDWTYLHFQAPVVKGNEVQLTLQGRIAPHDPAQRTVGLSTIQVTFRKVADRWELVGDPVYSAA